MDIIHRFTFTQHYYATLATFNLPNRLWLCKEVSDRKSNGSFDGNRLKKQRGQFVKHALFQVGGDQQTNDP